MARAKKKIQEYPNLVLDSQAIQGELDWNHVFDRSAPVHIEIGSGKGTFLVSQARAFPDINYLGIEWANKFYRHAVDRFGRWALENVRMIRTDAAEFISECIQLESIQMFHIYFPDPWPKKRHNKRRFLDLENTTQLLNCLEVDGIINIATDHEDYFQQIRHVADMLVQNGKAIEIPFVRPAGAQEGELVGTNYERKYIKEGRSTYTLALKKI